MNTYQDLDVGELDALLAGLGEIRSIDEVATYRGNMTLAERLQTIDQAILVISQLYVHLPMKRPRHAIDPVASLHLLRREADDLSDAMFQIRLLEVLDSLRDVHLAYTPPEPWAAMVAFLPFLLERVGSGHDRAFIVSGMVAQFRHSTFEAGVEVTSWNGVPILRAIELLAEQEGGNNRHAREALALQYLTVRWLGANRLPDEHWVAVGYRDANGDRFEIRIPWRVMLLSRDPGFRFGSEAVWQLAQIADQAKQEDHKPADLLRAPELSRGLSLRSQVETRTRHRLFTDGAAEKAAEERLRIAQGQPTQGPAVEETRRVASQGKAHAKVAKLPPEIRKTVKAAAAAAPRSAAKDASAPDPGPTQPDTAPGAAPYTAPDIAPSVMPATADDIATDTSPAEVKPVAHGPKHQEPEPKTAAAEEAGRAPTPDAKPDAKPADMPADILADTPRDTPPAETPDPWSVDPVKSYLPLLFEAETLKLGAQDWGYLRIRSFAYGAPSFFLAEARRLLRELPQSGVIIDVRGNPGGTIQCAELMLQLISPRRIEPLNFQFLGTELARKLTHAPAGGEGGAPRDNAWGRAVDFSLETGAVYSGGRPLTDPEQANANGQSYYGPCVLVIDATSFSAAEMFAAGFQDHCIGPILGLDPTTGGAGANCWTFDQFERQAAKTAAMPVKKLAGGAHIRFSVRRCMRTGPSDGAPLEEFGVEADHIHAPTPLDIIDSNRDLKHAAIRLLAAQRRASLSVKADVSGGMLRLTVMPRDANRIDVYIDGRPIASVDTNDSETSVISPLPFITNQTVFKLRVEAWRDGEAVANHCQDLRVEPA
ncbi:MAG: S41 family peptidase [Pseudomonadota bacterium]